MRQRHSNNSNHNNGMNNEKGTVDTFYRIILVFVTAYVYKVSNISYTSYYEIISMADSYFCLKNGNPKYVFIAATVGVRKSIIYTCTLGGLQMWQMKCNTFWVQIESCKMNVCHF